MIKIDSTDLNKFSVILRELPDEIKNDVRKVVKNSAFNIERNAKSSASVKTGHLKRSISTKMGDMEAIIHTSNLKYAPMVEFGTRPHIIRAKNKKALYWKGASHPVKQVSHPGSKAKPYLIPAFEKEKDQFLEKLKEVIRW
jgi:HK97 gp10 family phage protein